MGSALVFPDAGRPVISTPDDSPPPKPPVPVITPVPPDAGSLTRVPPPTTATPVDGGVVRDASVPPDAGFPPDQPQVIFVDSTAGNGGALNRPLTNGRTYDVQIEGTYSLWDSSAWNQGVCAGRAQAQPTWPTPNTFGPAGSDAEFIFAWPVGAAECPNGRPTMQAPHVARNLRIDVDGNGPRELPPSVEGAYQPQHIYHYVIRGAGQVATFSVFDSVSSDNNGRVRITVTGRP